MVEVTRTDRRTSNSRQDILEAAQRLASREGAGKLTIEAVAREAGLSKGGVLYNFPSKDLLLKGMLDWMIETIAPLIDEHRDALEGQPNRTLRALIKASDFKAKNIDPSVPMAILAVAAEDPELLAPMRAEMQARWQQVLDDGTDPELAALLWAAADGLMFHCMLGTGVFPEERRTHLLGRLDELATQICK
ncbi:TetR/AcrR family transcriptional regulator [Nitratireductor luteus]|uniref:TetR/AcrR family transcriptional regulator n=1 Tax=Nitratireductor luteus TaxID=2976980 RepID=UPI00223EAB81|nr:TetR/AcrR family transcriptional regulator [Nitratireductor luteus]